MRFISLIMAFLVAVVSGGAMPVQDPRVAPVGSNTRCLAVALVLIASEEDTLTMGRELLAYGPANGASDEDMRRIRALMAESERGLAQARAVRTHYAAAPVDRATADYLNESVSVNDLYVELQGCAADTPAAPVQSLAGFVREDGMDRAGNDIGVVEVGRGDFEACRAACAGDSRCRAFTLYTPPPRDRSFCWIKNAAGAASANPDTVSGVRQ